LNIAYIITIFSFAGIPPFAGFFSKFNILLSLYDKGYIFICLIVIIMTLLSTYYYLRLLAIVNFGGNPIPFDKKLRVFIDEILSVPNKFNKVLPIKDLISNIKKIKVIHFYDSFHFLLLLFTGYNTIFLFL
jgi:formate hydrogenlyase subunit 3/multisubunit Na+/H+ antiporter MnhD subunit